MSSLDDLEACLSDELWRLNNLYMIRDKSGNAIPFAMKPAQRQLYDEMSYRNVILKARQIGFSTLIQIMALDRILFTDNASCGVIAHTAKAAEEIFRDKIKFAYDNLPEIIRRWRPISNDTKTQIILGNGSSIRVGTSLRGSTFQFLHISEMGKIAANYPTKAREIVSGTLPTVPVNGIVFVESTAEGKEGIFYDWCTTAQSKRDRNERLTKLDYKFHFYPWWGEETNTLDEPVDPPPHLNKYFETLEDQLGIRLSDDQRAWYTKVAEEQDKDMKREHPSTPEEAFEAAIEGSYYASILTSIERNGQIKKLPYDPTVPVETWWDLGWNDLTVIWFVQRVAGEIRLIDYYECSGEASAHYAKVVLEKPYVYSRHVGPHDLEQHELGTGLTKRETFENLGLRGWVTAPKLGRADGIDAARMTLPRCFFDAEKCAVGLKHLREYRKQWNDTLGVWSSSPRHDQASNAADAFRVGVTAPAPASADFLRPLGNVITGAW